MPSRQRKIKPRDMDPRQLKFAITCLKCGSSESSQENYKCHRLEKRCSGSPALCGCCGLNYFTPLALLKHLNSKWFYKPHTSTATTTNSFYPLSFLVSSILVLVLVGPSSLTFSQSVSSSGHPTLPSIPSSMEGSRTVTPGPQYVQSATLPISFTFPQPTPPTF